MGKKISRNTFNEDALVEKIFFSLSFFFEKLTKDK